MLMPDAKQRLKELAGKTLKLNLSKDFNQVAFEFSKIIQELNHIYDDTEVPSFANRLLIKQMKNEWLLNHPIVQVLTQKLRNMAYPTPDVSYRVAEIVLTSICEDDNDSKRIQAPVRPPSTRRTFRVRPAKKAVPDSKA